ncbi:MAG TPA: acetyl-CoA C-acetyltransferase [Gemmatimonadales bacterium]|jgi:acetyl-CoA acetyltransferase family protein|nr:acetyl-CoA C-acetyltransferase [Gemmatimonadales bacterium]
MASRPDIVLLSGVRTGFGGFGGSLKDLSATELGAIAARAALERAGVDPRAVNHVVVGNAMQTSADAAYIARHVGLRAGCAIETPALTVNRLCGSGFEAIVQGAQQILLGESELVLSAGAESMSQAPHVVRGLRWGTRLGASPALEDSLWQGLTDQYCSCPMGITAENLAERYGITRAEVDAYALRSQQAAKAAWDAGALESELCPVPLQNRKTKQVEPWAADEHMRPETTAEGLAKLPPVFKPDGVVTAGNASGISDGAAACLVASAGFAERLGLRPIGRLIAWGTAGVDPTVMGLGPAPAARQALERAGMRLEQMDRVEVNEAFAAQYLAVERELGLDRSRTNVEGGAVALGHPLGASGTRITVHLLHTLRRIGKRYGLGSACIGGGQGIALIVEAFPA